MKKLKDLPRKEIENACGFELRHKSGVEPKDYLAKFLAVARQYGYATRDDSWGELEKELQIVFRRLETYKRFLHMEVHAQILSGNTMPVDEIRESLLEDGEEFWKQVQLYKKFDC